MPIQTMDECNNAVYNSRAKDLVWENVRTGEVCDVMMVV